jgi:hypothetical protein
MRLNFKAKIYKTGINWAVDVPVSITSRMVPEKGYIRIKGAINDFEFIQTLVPVKDGPYRLFVNGIMMKGGNTALGKTASFSVEQNFKEIEKEYAMPKLLKEQLQKNKLTKEFNALSNTRKKDILKYLHYIKTEETMQRHVDKVINQLKEKKTQVRIP